MRTNPKLDVDGNKRLEIENDFDDDNRSNSKTKNGLREEMKNKERRTRGMVIEVLLLCQEIYSCYDRFNGLGKFIHFLKVF